MKQLSGTFRESISKSVLRPEKLRILFIKFNLVCNNLFTFFFFFFSHFNLIMNNCIVILFDMRPNRIAIMLPCHSNVTYYAFHVRHTCSTCTRHRKEKKARKMSSLWCVHLHRSADGQTRTIGIYVPWKTNSENRSSFYSLSGQAGQIESSIDFLLLARRQVSASRNRILILSVGRSLVYIWPVIS